MCTGAGEPHWFKVANRSPRQANLVYLVVPTSVLIWWLIRTRWGLGLRTVGEDPAVAFAAGLKPDVLRYQALAIAGALVGIGGAHMSMRLHSAGPRE